MFAIAIIDLEANWDDPQPKSIMGSFETKEAAQEFAFTFCDRMERIVPDWTQVYSYEIVPIRTPEQNEAYYQSLVAIYNRADYREGNAVEMGWS